MPPTTGAEAPTPSKPRPLGRRLARGGLVAFVFAGFVLVGLLRPPSSEDWPLEVASLFERLEAKRDTVNAVFIGSSYTGYHLDPEVLAQAAAGHGLELDPVILALPAMEAFEADAIVDRLLRMELPQLKWIVIEYSTWDPEVIEEEFRGSRLTWWQSPERTGRLMKAAWAEARDDEDADDAFPLMARAMGRLALNYSRVGNVSEAEREKNQTLTEARRAAYSRRQADRRFVPEYREDLAEHREQVRQKGGWASAGDSRLRRFEAEAFARQIRQIREAGLQPFYFLPPSLIERGVQPDAAVIDFDDPDLYPQFFLPEHRLDAGHMVESQIEPFSRLTGRVFAGRVAGLAAEGKPGPDGSPSSPKHPPGDNP